MSLQFWEVEADTYEGSFDSGRTNPAKCSCTGHLRELGAAHDGGNPTSDLFVVKLCGREMTERGRLCEFLAALLAQALGVPAVKPAVVRIPQELAIFFPEPRRSFIAAGCGMQFGSQFVPHLVIYPPGKTIEARLLEQACNVFAFDMLIQNSDRRILKPNLFTNGETLTVLDHEMAFLPFILPTLGIVGDPWKLHQPTVLDHVLYTGLRGKSVDIGPFMERLRLLDDRILDMIAANIPAEWVSDDVNRVIAHIRAVRDNADRFGFEIGRVLK